MMANQSELPDGVAAYLIGETHEAVKKLEKMLLGNGDDGVISRLSHVERSCEEFESKIGELDRRVRVVTEPEDTARVRWSAIGHIAVALAAALSLALQFLPER